MKNFINFLPTWVETNIQPAFYDKESGSVLQQTARMYAKVNQLIRHFNELSKETSETVAEYIAKFVELKDFVDTYFENLDVQEEINNKLDQMAEDGELADIISQYLNSTAIFGYNSVADMKSAENLVNGSYARTLGYYSVNDGGGALYKIRTVTNDDVIDEAFIVEMNDSGNNLVAELVIEDNEVNIRQLGARSQENTNKYDIATYITKYLNKLDELENRLTLYIPAGVWYSSPITINKTSGYSIRGDHNFMTGTITKGTVITTLNDNQNYLIKFGDGEHMNSNIVIKDITFSTADFVLNANNTYQVDTVKTVTNPLVVIQGCQFGDTDNLYFQHINGTALSIASTWEFTYGKLFFRYINALNTGALWFDNITSIGGGINASLFKNVMFEQMLGNLITFKASSNFNNNTIQLINFEDYTFSGTGVVATSITDENVAALEASNPTRMSILKYEGAVYSRANVINNIQLNNVPVRFYTIGGNNYVFDRIMDIDTAGAFVSYIINNIDVLGMTKYSTILHSKVNVHQASSLQINNINNPQKYPMKFDVENFTYIKCDERMLINAGTVHHLPNNVTPFYQIVNNKQTGQRYITSDDDSLSNAKLCVKSSIKGDVYAAFLLTSRVFNIRAKIPSSETCTIIVNNGSVYKTFDLVGTGGFKTYEIDVTSTAIHIGDNVTINTTNGSANANILLDCLIA